MEWKSKWRIPDDRTEETVETAEKPYTLWTREEENTGKGVFNCGGH